MATSLLFNVNKFVLLEYIYSDGISSIDYQTNDVQFRRISNAYTGEDTIVNDDNSKPITRNVVDNTVVDLNNGRYALLDNDSAYFYPSTDPNITVSNITIAPVLNVVYDKVRVHILSGYNFEDLEGFMISLYHRTNNDKKLRVCDLSYLKSDQEIFFNPRPLKLSELIYDKYVEFLVPSQADMLEDQENNPQSTTTLSYYLTNGIYLANQNTIYCEFREIREIETEDGLVYFRPNEEIRFAFSSKDQFDLLTASIQEANDGDYFQYQALWDGQSIEDFIFRLNSVVGNNYFIIHELRVFEQVGITFNETDNVTSIQTTDFDLAKRFRPILQLTATAVSFTLEYTVRLYNSVDGKSIFKTSSLSSTDINKYGKQTMKLNVGDVTQPIKAYNQIVGNPIYNVVDNLSEITKTKILSTYVSTNDIGVKSDADLNRGVGVTLSINPFDNFFKFNLTTLADPSDSESVTALQLSTISKYFMVFIKNDNTKMYIDEFISNNFDKNEGEIAFKLNKQSASEVVNYNNRNFYIVSRNPNGIESVIFSGLFITDTDDQSLVQTINNLAAEQTNTGSQGSQQSQSEISNG